MPAYIVYGFRWPREGWSGVRVHTIVHNLEDCSAEYIQNAQSREELLGSFKKLYPETMEKLETEGTQLEFIEPYDPNDTTSEVALTQPYAYVAFKVVELGGDSIVQSKSKANDKSSNTGFSLGINLEEVLANGHGLTPAALEGVTALRDQVAADEKIGWWVVYNGDPERAYDKEDYEEEDEEEEGATTPTVEKPQGTITPSSEKQAAPLPQTQQLGPPVPPKTTTASTAPVSQVLPTRSKPEPPKPDIRPEVVLPPPKIEQIPEPAKLKEVTKKSGFRSKFFGKKI